MLSINLDGIKNQVKPEVKNVNKYLEMARNILVSISIPTDFSYYSQLKNSSQDILNIKNAVNTIDKWLDSSINSFGSVENKNKSLLGQISNRITSNGFNLNESMNVVNIQSGTISEEIYNFVEMSKQIVGNAFEYISDGSLMLDITEIAQKTGAAISNAITSVESSISLALEAGCKIGEEVISTISEKINSAIDFVDSKISSAWNTLYNNVIEPAINVIQTVGASIANLFVALTKGIAQLGESLFDLLVIIDTGCQSVFTGAIDGISYLGYLASGSKGEWTSSTKEMWKKTMTFVAEDHVSNAYKGFYEDTAIGKWLDEHAIDIFKSDGIASEVASGIGYVAGIVLLTVATGGLGLTATIPTTVTAAGIAGTAAVGKYTRRIMGRKKRFILGRYTKDV